jgi:hypothetical protein
MDPVPAGTTAPAATEAAGTISPPATPKPAKVTGKLTLTVEYTGDVDESKEYSKNIVKTLRDAGLTVKAEFAETVPSKRAL